MHFISLVCTRCSFKTDLGSIVHHVLKTSDIRRGAAKLLSLLLLFLNKNSEAYLESMLVHLYKAVDDDDVEVRTSVLRCAQSLGVYVPARPIIDLMAKHLSVPLQGFVPSKLPDAAKKSSKDEDDVEGDKFRKRY